MQLVESPRHRLKRRRIDSFAAWVITLFGVLIIGLVGMIFFLLLYQIYPLLTTATTHISAQNESELRPSEIYISDRNNAIISLHKPSGNEGARFQLEHINERGEVIPAHSIPGVDPQSIKGELYLDSISRFDRAFADSEGVTVLTSAANIVAIKVGFKLHFSDAQTSGYVESIPQIQVDELWGGEIFAIPNLTRVSALSHITLANEAGHGIAATDGTNVFIGVVVEQAASLWGGGGKAHLKTQRVLVWEDGVTDLRMTNLGHVLFVDKQGRLVLVKTADDRVVSEPQIIAPRGQVSHLESLLGGNSVVVASPTGGLRLFSQTREPSAVRLWRQYESMDKPIIALARESRRKAFWALSEDGTLGGYYIGETGRTVTGSLPESAHDSLEELIRSGVAGGGGGLHPAVSIRVAPRDNTLAVMLGTSRYLYTIENEHPEASLSLLWAPKLYESYEEKQWIWQSSSGDTDFEPKLSLTPLVLGTAKGALFALLFAIPMALLAAIYTAIFMPLALRQIIKPWIEMMGALPTVILGFLGGIWLAPIIEARLLGFLLIPLVLLGGLALMALAIERLSNERMKALQGYEFIIGGLFAAGAIWFSLEYVGPVLEQLFFDGQAIVWLEEVLDIKYQQRNALIVGVAMGFAVVPVIYSIAEDSIYEVPEGLVNGSLALGANLWQTTLRVVIPTASPGIFAALMMGLGRAVGETMIVMMATGNTPLISWSGFDGMRTLSAGIAVEMPEAEAGSTHFRVLYLSAMVLLVMTFAFNTLAELIRERLRETYSRI